MERWWKNDISAMRRRSTNGTRSYFYLVTFGQIQTLPTCNLINLRHNSNHCIRRTISCVCQKMEFPNDDKPVGFWGTSVSDKHVWIYLELRRIRELSSQAICFPTHPIASTKQLFQQGHWHQQERMSLPSLSSAIQQGAHLAQEKCSHSQNWFQFFFFAASIFGL